MRTQKAILSKPLSIDVSKIASYLSEFRYRGPFQYTSGEKCTSEYIMNDEDTDKFAVLLFDGKNSEGFTTISSNYSPKELAVFLTRLPQELSQPLIDSLRTTALAIPSLSGSELAFYQKEAEHEKEKNTAFKKLQQPLKNAQYVDFKKELSVAVIQHEYAVTTATSAKPIIGTYGAGPCLIVALYDESNKTAVLAHVDALTNIYSLNTMIRHISPEHTVAHLFGGDSSSKSMCIKIVELLKENKIAIVNSDIVRSDYDPASLAIDARTGALYSPVSPFQLEETTDLNARLQITGLQFSSSPSKRYQSQAPAVETQGTKKFASLQCSSLPDSISKSKPFFEPEFKLDKYSGANIDFDFDFDFNLNKKPFRHFGQSNPSFFTPMNKENKLQEDKLLSEINEKLHLLIGAQCTLKTLLDCQQIIKITPEPSYEKIKMYAAVLKLAGLTSEAQEPLILSKTTIFPAQIMISNSLDEVLKALTTMTLDTSSQNQASSPSVSPMD